jgi:hypothetical protein
MNILWIKVQKSNKEINAIRVCRNSNTVESFLSAYVNPIVYEMVAAELGVYSFDVA